MQNPENPSTVVRKTFSLPATLWQEIEDYQFQHRIKKDAEVLRRLLELGLRAAKEADESSPAKPAGKKLKP
jgi:hypothetical protein